jgi:hypothetical protein
LGVPPIPNRLAVQDVIAVLKGASAANAAAVTQRERTGNPIASLSYARGNI